MTLTQMGILVPETSAPEDDGFRDVGIKSPGCI
jgi:hypothetical protein